MTRQSAGQANLRLDRVLVREGDREVTSMEVGSRIPDTPLFDSKQPKELRL